MKYRYKISYGGTSSTSGFVPHNTTTRSNDFDAVDELDNLFINLNQINKNYDQNNFDIKEFNYDEYNDPIIGKIYDQNDYKIIDDNKLLKIIPFIIEIYIKYYKEFNNEINTYIIKKILPEESKIIYLGDYHSSVHSLIDVIKNLQKKNILTNEYKLADNYYLVFLGDIVDRGPLGIECIYIIYILFYINNQEEERVFILNGNHEEKNTYIHYGFSTELKKQLDENSTKLLEELINYLPLALFIKNNKVESKWYQFCHGGIDNRQLDFNFFNNFLNSDNEYLELYYNPTELIGFLWSDFTTFNKYKDNFINEIRNQLEIIPNNLEKEIKKIEIINSLLYQSMINVENQVKRQELEMQNQSMINVENQVKKQELINIDNQVKRKELEMQIITSNINLEININILSLLNKITNFMENDITIDQKIKILNDIRINVENIFKLRENENFNINENIEKAINDIIKMFINSTQVEEVDSIQVEEVENNKNIIINNLIENNNIIINSIYRNENFYFRYNTRPLYNDFQVKSILDKLKIMTIISGHQDQTNYAFLLRDTVSVDTSIKIEENIYDLDKKYGNEFGLCSFNLDSKNVDLEKKKEEQDEDDYVYEYSEDEYSEDEEHVDIEIEKEINMNDILASVISSATISKDLQYSIYGILNLDTNMSQIYYLSQNSGKLI